MHIPPMRFAKLKEVKFLRQMTFATTDFGFNIFDNSIIEKVSIYTFSDELNRILQLSEAIGEVKSVRVVQTTSKQQEFLGNIVDLFPNIVELDIKRIDIDIISDVIMMMMFERMPKYAIFHTMIMENLAGICSCLVKCISNDSS